MFRIRCILQSDDYAPKASASAAELGALPVRSQRSFSLSDSPGDALVLVRLTVVKVLVTGGAGYLGSITASALEEAGHTPIILDSLVTGPRQFIGNRIFYEGDIGDGDLLAAVVRDHPDLHSTVHMAAKTIVPESVEQPYEYYANNVSASLELLANLARLGKPRVLFSSSASVYGLSPSFEVDETSLISPASPYASTKWMVEVMLTDLAAAGHLRAMILRYFNPIGSDPAVRTGIYVRRPTHVLGQLLLTAQGQQPFFTITGTDYPTRDGTGQRDYVHAWDLAQAHVRAVEQFDAVLDAVGQRSTVLNIGTGVGVTVRELVTLVEKVIGRPLPVKEAPRRPGDVVGAYANVDKAQRLLNWEARLTVEDGIRSALAWAAKRKQVLGFG